MIHFFIITLYDAFIFEELYVLLSNKQHDYFSTFHKTLSPLLEENNYRYVCVLYYSKY